MMPQSAFYFYNLEKRNHETEKVSERGSAKEIEASENKFGDIIYKEEESSDKDFQTSRVEQFDNEVTLQEKCLFYVVPCFVLPTIIGVLIFCLLPPLAITENKLKNDFSSETKKEEEEKKKKEEVNGSVINGDSGSRFAGIAAVPMAVGIGVASGAAVSGINELIDSNNLVNAKVKVNETVDANKLTDGRGTPEKAKNSGDNESNKKKIAKI